MVGLIKWLEVYREQNLLKVCDDRVIVLMFALF